MILVIMLAALIVLSTVALLVARWLDHDRAPHRITPRAKRILFPVLGDTLSTPALDATLRYARAEGATLVPAYILTVPLSLPITAPLPVQCGSAMPLLETIEQRAARIGVPVDSRVETGRTPRHALKKLLSDERFDRIVVPAATSASSGFDSYDISWLLENAPGEIVVFRAEPNGGRVSKGSRAVAAGQAAS